jgi:hypothetical protein
MVSGTFSRCVATKSPQHVQAAYLFGVLFAPHWPSLSAGTSEWKPLNTNSQFPFKRPAISAQAGYGYKDQCLKLADVRRTDTVAPAAAIPCRRSHSCKRVVVDRH